MEIEEFEEDSYLENSYMFEEYELYGLDDDEVSDLFSAFSDD